MSQHTAHSTRDTWLAYLSANMLPDNYRERPANTWKRLEETVEDGKQQITLYDLEEGIALTLLMLPEENLVHVSATAMERPIPTDPSLAFLAITCNAQPEFTSFTFGPENIDFPDSQTNTMSDTLDKAFTAAKAFKEILYVVIRERDRQDLGRYALGCNLWYTEGTRPWQAYGEWQGHLFAFRMRGNIVSLSFALPGQSPIEQPAWRSAFECTIAETPLSFRDFSILFCYLASTIKRAEFPYQFKVIDFPDEATEKVHEFVSEEKLITIYGHTAEEAYAKTKTPGYKGWAVDPQPVNTDTRVYPENDPVFPIKEGTLEKAEELIIDIMRNVTIAWGTL